MNVLTFTFKKMDTVAAELQGRLEQLKLQISNSAIPKTSVPVFNNWQAPPISKSDLERAVDGPLDLLAAHANDIDPEDMPLLRPALSQLEYLSSSTLPQLIGKQLLSVTPFLLGLHAVERTIRWVIPRATKEEVSSLLARQRSRLRATEARIASFDERTADLQLKIERIENAHDAATSLPTDLEELKQGRQTLKQTLEAATAKSEELEAILAKAIDADRKFDAVSAKANDVIQKCERALANSTGVGLAAAFSKRSNTLGWSVYFWLVGLVAALALGYWFGRSNLSNVSSILADPNATASALIVSALLSIISVGAPGWFAWLATTQIGQRFRLAEDYAFKASISLAYDGYRQEAARVDALTKSDRDACTQLEASLLASALRRLDELPLRLVEQHSHASPLAELLNSKAVKEAASMSPQFSAAIVRQAEEITSRLKGKGKTVSGKSDELPSPKPE